MPASVLERLREGTAAIHEHLDASLPLARETLDPTTYVALLHGFRVIQGVAARELERHRDALMRFGYDIDSRRELEWIGADLEWWRNERGVDLPNVAGRLAHEPAPGAGSVSEAFGWVYVLEGSTLGGQVIVRRLATSLDLMPPEGCRYFWSYGEDVGPRWRNSCNSLAAVAASWPEPERDAETSRMVRAARELFEYIDRTLHRTLQAPV